MYYAIEYAYGAHVVNNGNRADRVLAFSRPRLRDRWIDDGPADSNAAGYRAKILAKDARVAARYLDIDWDGDWEAWPLAAAARVEADDLLRPYTDLLLSGEWGVADHMEWVTTASFKELLEWCIATRSAQQSVMP